FVNGAGINLTQGVPGGYQDVVSADAYFFTDTDNRDAYQGQCFYNGCGIGGNLTADQTERAYNYALVVKRLRDLDALDGKREPVVGQIERGWGEADRGYRTITPAEMHGALWQSIIAGARGVVYFPFSWNAAACTRTDYIQRAASGCFTGIQNQAKADNQLVAQLAPVINAPFADGYVTAGAGINAMASRGAHGKFYVFAGNKDNQARTAGFTLAGGQGSTATVVGENRSVAI